MSTEQRDFEVDVRVNKYKLDQENQVQASTYHYWASLLAEAKTEVDTCDEQIRILEGQMKEVRAKEELDIRENGDPSLKKVTEAGVVAVLETRGPVVKKREEIHNAREKAIKAKNNVYILEAAVKALEHRRDSLGNLTQLWCKGYYSKPTGSSQSAGDDVSADIRKDLNS